jgi:cyclopropane-fatty-acyl-phospholipid synthase
MKNLLPLNILVKKFFRILKKIETGHLILITPKGRKFNFVGKNSGIKAELKIYNWEVIRNLINRGDIGFGEDYIEKNWDTPELEGLISLLLINKRAFEDYYNGNLLNKIFFRITNSLVRKNSKKGSKKNIQAHYDVGNDFYQLWLDETMTYSSAIYGDDQKKLRDAQIAKYSRILDKIGNESKEILEIGCGWGGFAEQAIKKNHKLTGLTISPAQFNFAIKRLGEKAKILLQDYREITGKFDAIVSIEMFEAVGEKYWPDYFKTIKNRLKKTGTAVVQTITISDEEFEEYRKNSDFIRQYTFPGGMLPSVEVFKKQAEIAGLKCKDIFLFGKDYAQTLRDWLQRFDEKRSEILAMGYSEEFIRNWRFYLGICAAAFSVGKTNVMQVVLEHE